MKRILTGLTIIGALLLVAPIGHSADEQEKKPDGRVKMTGKSLAAGVGFSWGSGVLTYQGKEYPFSISGLSAGNIGASSAELSGQVFNLKNLDDFNGNYTSAGAGAPVDGGGGAATRKDRHVVGVNAVASA